MLAVRPGEEMLDTNGARIQAHGARSCTWTASSTGYGENKEHTVPGSGIWHWGVRCYASTDLYTWEDQGLIISPELGDTSSPLHPAQLLDRPHIVRQPDSGRFVCWLRVSSRAGRPQALLVLVADSILGPYTKVRLGLRPFGMDAGDFDLVVTTYEVRRRFGVTNGELRTMPDVRLRCGERGCQIASRHDLDGP
jgi:hypothetical protein